MSLESYRRAAQRKREEISKLQINKARESKKVADASKRISSANQALSRTKSMATAKSRAREIEREQKKTVTAEKKIADIEKKIASKNKELSRELDKISKEESKQQKARDASHNRELNKISVTLNHHDEMHKDAQSKLRKLLPEKIKVLFVASNPLDQSQLRLDEEAREITEKIRASKHRNSVEFVTRWAARPLDLLQALNEHNPSIVHFSGHGSDQDELVFQGDDGNTKLVSKDAIVQTIMAASDHVRLVFFNACYSQPQAEEIVKHVEAAIGMNTTIGDNAAKVFSASFYSAIGFGLSVDKAFKQGKAALMLESIPEEDTPELFVQNGLRAEEIVIVKATQVIKGENL